MKKIYSMMLVAAAATAFFSCQKQEAFEPETTSVSGLTFTSEKPEFVDETKTEWTGESIQWSAGDKIRIAYTCDDVWQNADGTATAAEEDGSKTAKFYPSSALEDASDVAQFEVPGRFVGNAEGEYVFYGIYPSSVVGSSDMKNAPSFNIIVPSVQTPLADSFDPESDVMVAQSASYVGMPDEAISLLWDRQVAHAYLTLKAINGISDDEQVLNVKITAQDAANMVGMQTYDMETGEFVKHAENATANVLEISGANLSVENGNIVFWSSFLPCTWESFTVELNTDAATYTRVVETCNLEFKKNARNTLAINMQEADVTPRVAEMTATLTFDDKAKRTEYSTSKQVWKENGITITNNKASSTNNVADYAAPARFYKGSSLLIEAPGSITKIVFDCNSSEYATAMKNSSATITGATATVSSDKVTVTFASALDQFFVTEMTAQARVDAVTVTYQPAGSSESPDLTPVLDVTETSLQIDYVDATSVISVTAKNLYDIEANTFVDSDCTTDCGWLAAEWTPEGISYTVSENDTEELRKGYIQLVAYDSDGVEYSEVIAISQATSYIAELTVEEFLAKEVNPYMWYQLTGVMSNIVENNAFGNFDITDDTETVYVYGLTATKKASNDQSFASLGLRNGDELTLIGTRSEYNSKAQVGGPAYYVDHVAAPYLEVSKNAISVAADATSADFTVDANVEWTVSCSTATATKSGNKVTVAFEANETAEAVVYEVVVTSELGEETVTITQAAASQGGGEMLQKGTSYTYTFTAKQWSANGDKALGDLTWTLAGGGGYWGYDGTKGQQFGSGSKPYKSMTLSTSDYEGGVQKIVINTSGASSINASFTVTVGGVQYGSSTKLTTAATEYTFEVDEADMKEGEIVFTYTQTSSKAIYIKSISIN